MTMLSECPSSQILQDTNDWALPFFAKSRNTRQTSSLPDYVSCSTDWSNSCTVESQIETTVTWHKSRKILFLKIGKLWWSGLSGHCWTVDLGQQSESEKKLTFRKSMTLWLFWTILVPMNAADIVGTVTIAMSRTCTNMLDCNSDVFWGSMFCEDHNVFWGWSIFEFGLWLLLLVMRVWIEVECSVENWIGNVVKIRFKKYLIDYMWSLYTTIYEIYMYFISFYP
jgi:hypothetical protein